MRACRETAILIGLVLAASVCLGVPDSAHANESIVACGPQPNSIFRAQSPYGLTAQANCPGGVIQLTTGVVSGYKKGQNAIWQTTAPSGLQISSASIPSMVEQGVNAGSAGDYGGDFYWGTSRANITPGETHASFSAINSPDFGFNLVCGLSTCGEPNAYATINVSEIDLNVTETITPTLNSPTGLWQASGWVRGKWPFVLSSDSPSGVCLLAASLNSQPIAQTTSASNPAVWHQCDAAPISTTVDTTSYGQGQMPLALLSADAAAVHVGDHETLSVDNQQPTVSLTGPSDALSTAGTQYVTATAAAGPSGVAGISCSVDGAPAQWYPESPAQVAVGGVGEHQVQCSAENNAVDAGGVHGTSATQSFAIKIGEPTVAAVAFSTIVNRLRCHRVTERLRIPARWVTVHVHGRVVRVREKARIQTVKVTRCHARTIRRRVTRRVTVHRHGKTIRVIRTRLIRVVLEPRRVFKTTERVGHGKPAEVDGWLGTTAGVALGGQTVQVLTAPDNGRENFHVAAVTTTAANGAWTARLRAGPSRLIEAVYPGAATTEATTSAPVHLIVPAKVQLLKVSPRRVAWGGAVRLVARLTGGYLPAGGALIRLRIGEGHLVTTYGVREHVHGNGRFSTTYRFGEGQHSVHLTYWFQIASLPMGDYPYAPADSAKIAVTVGGHPAPPPPPPPPPAPKHRHGQRGHKHPRQTGG
jgi:hypothetical protein